VIAALVLDTDSKPSRPHLMRVDDDPSIQLPPHSIEAEQAVLGALLQDNTVADVVRGILTADDFFKDAHRHIFRHIEQLLDGGEQSVDLITVAESLKAVDRLDYVSGLAYLGALAQNVPTSAHAEHYARIVRERSRRRAIKDAAGKIADAAAAPGAPDSATLLTDARERIEELSREDNAAGAQPLDLAAMAAAPVPERRFRVGRIMPMGTPGLWSGHGGAGKTQAALHLAICIALGRDFFGEPVEAARVGFVSTEDDAADLHYRLAQQVRVASATLEELAGRLFLYDLTAADPTIIAANDDGDIVATPRYGSLRAEFRRRDIAVVFLDNFATLCAVDLIRPAHATQAIALCHRLVPDDGNAVLIAHVDKATAKSGHSREAYSGTAAFHNRARWRWFVFSPNRRGDAEDGNDEQAVDDGRRTLEVQKVNAGRSGARIPLRILDNGAIATDGPADGIVAQITRQNERQAVLACIAEADARGMHVPAARSGPSTAYDVLPAMPSYPDALRGKAGKKRLLTLLVQMQASGDVAIREKSSKGGHVREFITLTRVHE
jgi:RecA-family ATPase